MKKLLLVISIVLGFISCTKDESGTTGSIYGVVTVKETAEPMRATGVELYNDGLLILRTVTYDDGHYEFENLTAGEYWLRIVASGYEEASYNVIVESGRTARADMQLDKIDTHITVRTLGVTVLSYNSVQFNGKFIYNSYTASYPNEVGFLYSQSHSDIANGKRLTGTVKKNEDFYIEAKGLAAGTWYVLAYATNYYGTQYGEIQSFEISGQPSVTTLDATNITATTATLNGYIEYEGDPAYTERGFVYSSSYPNPTVDDPTTATTKIVVSGTSKEFSANIAGLKDNTAYYVRAYAINNTGIVYGNAVEFSHRDFIILSSDGIMVQKHDITPEATWSTANSLCKGSTLGNFSDWRLPTNGECSILYENQSILVFVTQDTYWTSSYYTGYSSHYYYDFYSGRLYSPSYSSSDDKLRRARCVRTLK